MWAEVSPFNQTEALFSGETCPSGRRCLLTPGCARPFCPEASRCATLRSPRRPRVAICQDPWTEVLGCRYLGVRASANSVALLRQVRPRPNNWRRGASRDGALPVRVVGNLHDQCETGRARRIAWRALWKGWRCRIPGVGLSFGRSVWTICCRARSARLPKRPSGPRVPSLRPSPKRRVRRWLLVPGLDAEAPWRGPSPIAVVPFRAPPCDRPA